MSDPKQQKNLDLPILRRIEDPKNEMRTVLLVILLVTLAPAAWSVLAALVQAVFINH